MKGSMRKMLCWGLAALSMGVMLPGASAAEKASISLPQKMSNGETVEVYYRKGLPVSAVRARAAELKQEKMGKGTTLSNEEVENLYDLLKNIMETHD